MARFEVTQQNTIAPVEAGRKRQKNSGSQFASESEFIALTASWPNRRLVQIWNGLPGVTPVVRFASRRVAVRRILLELQRKLPQRAVIRLAQSPPDQSAPVGAPMAQTKAARIVALVGRPTGATLTEIMAETGWQPHSVRGFVSGHLGKRMGHRVQSFTKHGMRAYRICANSASQRELALSPSKAPSRKNHSR